MMTRSTEHRLYIPNRTGTGTICICHGYIILSIDTFYQNFTLNGDRLCKALMKIKMVKYIHFHPDEVPPFALNITYIAKYLVYK